MHSKAWLGRYYDGSMYRKRRKEFDLSEHHSFGRPTPLEITKELPDFDGEEVDDGFRDLGYLRSLLKPPTFSVEEIIGSVCAGKIRAEFAEK